MEISNIKKQPHKSLVICGNISKWLHESYTRTTRLARFAEKTNPYLLAAIPYLMIFYIPTYFAFIMMQILGPLVDFYHMGPLKHGFHVTIGSWFFVNILGNLLMGISVNISLGENEKGCKYCNKCEKNRSIESWHCFQCNCCVIRRDHHCYLMSRCIGLNNYRYFILFVFHGFFSMLYSTYYLYYFISLITAKRCHILLTIFRLVVPVARFYVQDSLSFRDLYVFFLIMNIGMICVSGYYLSFHSKNMLMGLTSRESKPLDMKVVKKNWKGNVKRVLGKRWYLTVFCPFIESPLEKIDCKEE